MGWTSIQFVKATHTTLTEKQAFEFIQRENSAFEFAMFHFVPAKDRYSYNECYMVMRHREKMKNFICCTIIEIKNGEIYWKDIEEAEAPAYYNCPANFFKFVQAPNKYAEKWREQCSKKNIQSKPITEYF